MITFPEEFGSGGQRLWSALVNSDSELANELNPMQSLAIDACRAKDRADILEKICGSEPVMVDNGKGQPVAHPAWVESRKIANHIEMLIAALRLPDKVTGKRPQRHMGAIHGRRPGVHPPRAGRRGARRGFWTNGGGGDAS